MKIIDCTPPADFPAMCLMMTATGFYVRISDENSVKVVDLPGEETLPGAVMAADRLGHHCEKWCDVRGGYAFAMLIPSGIRRVRS